MPQPRTAPPFGGRGGLPPDYSPGKLGRANGSPQLGTAAKEIVNQEALRTSPRPRGLRGWAARANGGGAPRALAPWVRRLRTAGGPLIDSLNSHTATSASYTKGKEKEKEKEKENEKEKEELKCKYP